MNENVENLILTQLREIRADISGLRQDIADTRGEIREVRSDIGDLDQKVNGVTTLLTLLAGYVHGIEERVEKLELGTRT